jgi:hypothetical protein
MTEKVAEIAEISGIVRYPTIPDNFKIRDMGCFSDSRSGE